MAQKTIPGPDQGSIAGCTYNLKSEDLFVIQSFAHIKAPEYHWFLNQEYHLRNFRRMQLYQVQDDPGGHNWHKKYQWAG